jgi:gas vesicle protein
MLKLFSVRRDPDMRLSAPHGGSDQIRELLKEELKKIRERNTHLIEQNTQFAEQRARLIEENTQTMSKVDSLIEQRAELKEQNTRILNTVADHIKQLKEMRALEDGFEGQIIFLKKQVYELNKRVGRQEE